jgi:hypothetical protein
MSSPTTPVAEVKDAVTSGEREKHSSDLESGTQSQTQLTMTDPNDDTPEREIVWWEGDDDQANPMNWSQAKKWSHVAVLGIITFITYVAPGPRKRLIIDPEIGRWHRPCSRQPSPK